MNFSIIDQIFALVQTAPTQAKSGFDKVTEVNGWLISVVGIMTVFIGLVVLVLIINLFGKLFTRKKKSVKADREPVTPVENADEAEIAKLMQGKSKSITQEITIAKESTSDNAEKTNIQQEVEEKVPEKTKKEMQEQENAMQETLAAVALAIHAELHLFHPDIVTNIDYPTDVSSWAFSSRPLRNSHFDRLYRNH